MLLGDVIARFEDEVFASEALFALDDIILAARVGVAAAEEELTPGKYAARSVDAFVSGASDEEWLTMLGQMSRAEDPGKVFLHRVLSNAVSNHAKASLQDGIGAAGMR
jgi:hypothetical protein